MEFVRLKPATFWLPDQKKKRHLWYNRETTICVSHSWKGVWLPVIQEGLKCGRLILWVHWCVSATHSGVIQAKCWLTFIQTCL